MVKIKFNEVHTSEELEVFESISRSFYAANVRAVTSINFPVSGGVCVTLFTGQSTRDLGVRFPGPLTKLSRDCRLLLTLKLDEKLEEVNKLYELSKSF